MAHNAVHYHNELRQRRAPPSRQPSSTSATTPLTNTSSNGDANVHGNQQERDIQAQWPPVEHQSRASEFYGFVAWTSTYLAFVIYLLWAFLPDEYIIWLGVTWYPNREWAILIPGWSIMTVLFTYFCYFALAFARTPPFDHINSVTDGYAMLPDPQNGAYNAYIASTEPNAIPELYDIPLSMVNRVLYAQTKSFVASKDPVSHS